MPRCAREKSKSGIFHIMIRGINKQTIFEDDDDREKFLATIERYKNVSKYELYGYCLMSNHIHMILKETEEDISTAIKRICSSYVYRYNFKYGRCGHLFQERYKSEIVEDETYLLAVLRYIHQNPLKAGLTNNVEEYKWSSYYEYIKKSIITDTQLVLSIISDNREKAIASFIEYTKERTDDKYLDYDEKIQVTDEIVIKHIERLGLTGKNELQELDRDKRNQAIRELKKIKGVTIRQLSRITGISKSVIDRA